MNKCGSLQLFVFVCPELQWYVWFFFEDTQEQEQSNTTHCSIEHEETVVRLDASWNQPLVKVKVSD